MKLQKTFYALKDWIYRQKTWRIIVDSVYPRRCPVCEGLMTSKEGVIHDKCRKKLTYARGNVCMKCGKLLTDDRKEFCSDCEKDKKHYEAGRAVFLQDKWVAQSIYDYKYRNHREYADFYALEMIRLYSDQVRKWGVTAIVPIPVHGDRLRSRGYNQAELVAGHLSRVWEIPLRSEWLIRNRQTRTQKNLGRHDRKRNLIGAFSSPSNVHVFGRVLLIDDIYTTGATIDGCARTLKEAGAEKVFFLTISAGKD